MARFAAARPPTEASLRLAFPPAERAALAASRPDMDDKPFLARVLAHAEDLVTVRQGDRVLLGDPAAGVLARAQHRAGCRRPGRRGGGGFQPVWSAGRRDGRPGSPTPRPCSQARAGLADMAAHA